MRVKLQFIHFVPTEFLCYPETVSRHLQKPSAFAHGLWDTIPQITEQPRSDLCP